MTTHDDEYRELVQRTVHMPALPPSPHLVAVAKGEA